MGGGAAAEPQRRSPTAAAADVDGVSRLRTWAAAVGGGGWSAVGWRSAGGRGRSVGRG